MSLIDEGLERDRCVVSGKAVGGRSAGDEGAFADTTADFFCEFLLVGRALGILRFARVGKEAAFNQHGRDRRFSQNIESAAPDTAIGRRRAAGHVIMNSGRERQTLRTVKVSLNPVRAPATRGI